MSATVRDDVRDHARDDVRNRIREIAKQACVFSVDATGQKGQSNFTLHPEEDRRRSVINPDNGPASPVMATLVRLATIHA
jgi:hypothetical protein